MEDLKLVEAMIERAEGGGATYAEAGYLLFSPDEEARVALRFTCAAKGHTSRASVECGDFQTRHVYVGPFEEDDPRKGQLDSLCVKASQAVDSEVGRLENATRERLEAWLADGAAE